MIFLQNKQILLILELLYVIIELKRYQRRNRYGQWNAWQSHQHCTKEEFITKRAWRFAERFKQGRIKMENGEATPRSETLIKLYDILELNKTEILGFEQKYDSKELTV